MTEFPASQIDDFITGPDFPQATPPEYLRFSAVQDMLPLSVQSLVRQTASRYHHAPMHAASAGVWLHWSQDCWAAEGAVPPSAHVRRASVSTPCSPKHACFQQASRGGCRQTAV